MVQPQVQLIAWTHFEPPDDVPWSTDADGGQALAEFAGRACYQSLDASPTRRPRPTPATCGTSSRSGTCPCSSTASVTFYLTGVSRSLHPRADPAPALLVLASSPSATCPSGTRRWSSRT